MALLVIQSVQHTLESTHMRTNPLKYGDYVWIIAGEHVHQCGVVVGFRQTRDYDLIQVKLSYGTFWFNANEVE